METKVNTMEQVEIKEERTEMTKTEVVFGALMGIAAICGIWGVVSILISLFMGV